MKYTEMKRTLRELNKNWGLDMTLATVGNCCFGCSTFNNEKMEKDFEKAKTYLQVKWFQSGMNYNGTFVNQNILNLGYDLGDKVSISKVCKDLRKALKGSYKVFKPKNDMLCIKLQKLFTIDFTAIFHGDADSGDWYYSKPKNCYVLDRLFPKGYCEYIITVNQDGVITADTYDAENVGINLEKKYPELWKKFKKEVR